MQFQTLSSARYADGIYALLKQLEESGNPKLRPYTDHHRRRTVMEYLLSPVQKLEGAEAGRER